MAELQPMAILDDHNVVVQVINATVDYVDAQKRRAVAAPDGGVLGLTYNGAWPVVAPPPPPPPTLAQLVAYANGAQNRALALAWKFNVGTASSPLYATTRLDEKGRLSATRLGLWGGRNAANVNLGIAYSNMDDSVLTLSPAQAIMLSDGALDVEQQTYAALSAVKAAIAALQVTTYAAIDAWAWPVPKT